MPFESRAELALYDRIALVALVSLVLKRDGLLELDDETVAFYTDELRNWLKCRKRFEPQQ